MMVKTLQLIILFLLSCILSGAGGFIATHKSNHNVHVQQQGSQTTTALYDTTNDNKQKQLRVIDLPTELEAFEYVDEYDYASYDIFEDADRYVFELLIFLFLFCLLISILYHSLQLSLYHHSIYNCYNLHPLTL